MRRAGPTDGDAVAALRRAWVEQRGRAAPGEDPGFEQVFATWWRAELSHHVVWVAEAESGDGWDVVGSLDVAEVAAMPAPGRPGERWGYVGSLVALGAAPRGVPRKLLGAAVAHARERGLVRLVLRPSPAGAAFYRAAGFAPAGDDIVVLPTGGGPGGTS
ncbi:GNAT family N-acetyltransferase [Actinomycetospora lemnae]|uniref:GNAT family N-acetyltransferase n=1 Tax=Actinomycetospora lemnae TaxID=3019891 RepID=A0ABT5SW75_9PSEU|nr:GNAT family N-acetyltransferase [Actinomycetospora sp. DW7H6]MDD7967024.1 GNAT family N-acetyltransferase [Actinomycetospora sp. DW7H6]